MDYGSRAACSESRADCIYMDSGSSAACSESRAVCIWILGLGLLVVNLGPPAYGFWV